MKRHIFNLTLLLAAAFALTACTADDANSAWGDPVGKPAVENTVGAYFADTNAASFVHDNDDEADTVVVLRQNTDSAVTVPITVNYIDTTAISIPSSVTFAEGDSIAKLVLTYKGMNARKKYNFEIAIPSQYAADPYKEKDGTTVYQSSVVISTWIKIKENVKFYVPEAAEFPKFYSDIYQLEGVNQFYITDFLGCGNNIYFSLKSGFKANDLEHSAGYASITGDVIYNYSFSYDDGSVWPVQYLYFGTDESGEDIWNWTAGGVNFSSINWYSGYTYVDFESKYIYFYADIYSDTFSLYYQALYGVWN